MGRALVVKSDKKTTVVMPDEITLPEGQVDVRVVGNDVVLSPTPEKLDIDRFIQLLQELPDDMFEGIKDERPPETREEF
ncbi:hypothetical protein [Enterovirga aerilata]|uniref:AbrB/MazE/SpoVT family DNA-binding domain-containing protein n=1 Tax=Enterovirga aerilata TaxID=2730920 RepID=A0A849I989_9HYPH|nr:hypothetical protein [Enterovirga sp. DB1703]NNM74374.1 hypothetical protein [Enterovirga sp. DB1703]